MPIGKLSVSDLSDVDEAQAAQAQNMRSYIYFFSTFMQTFSETLPMTYTIT